LLMAAGGFLGVGDPIPELLLLLLLNAPPLF
jgi:hypothetical protein